MSALNFDTQKFRQSLEDKGMQTELAGAITRGLVEAIKQDIVAIPPELPKETLFTSFDLVKFERRLLFNIALIIGMEILLVLTIAYLVKPV